MPSARLCPQCSQPLPENAPQGLCPKCLFEAALAGQSALGSAVTNQFELGSSSTQAISPEAGVRIRYFGDYELIEEIARGGMGVVWKARQNSLNRIVAIKMIRAGALASAAEVQRFLREAEAAANLQHPNIVAIHEVGEHGGQHYFSMDYVDGHDLGALVQSGPLPAQRAARYVQVIADAIHYAHQRGTLHRDLKPQNVLIDAADQPRITDFGLAKLIADDSRLTQSGVVMGSPSYMPPEQASGRHDEIGPHSDVYSIGAILYELLTGRAPFCGATAMATLREVLDTEPVAPRRLNLDVPPDLETICLKCLEKSPTARYPNARELAEDLRRFLDGEPIHARPASVVRKTITWVRRHPSGLVAAAACVMLAMAYGGLYLFEENAFLRAKQAQPALVREIGPRNANLDTWGGLFGIFAALFGTLMMLYVAKRGKRLRWKDLFDPASQLRSLQPLGDRLRTLATCVGVFCAGSGLALLVKAIQAQVWEGYSPRSCYVFAYFGVYYGLWLISQVVRDYRNVVFGTPNRQLPPEQLQSIRQALMAGDLPSAIRLYGQAVPDAGLAERCDFAQRMYAALRAEFPDQVKSRPSLSLTALNWSAIIVCLCAEGILVGLTVFAIPAAELRAPLFYYLAAGFLWGLGIVGGARLKGLGKRLLIQAPGVAMIILGSKVVGHVEFWPVVLGSLGGMFLMISGFTPRRLSGNAKT